MRKLAAHKMEDTDDAALPTTQRDRLIQFGSLSLAAVDDPRGRCRARRGLEGAVGVL